MGIIEIFILLCCLDQPWSGEKLQLKLLHFPSEYFSVGQKDYTCTYV